MSNERFVEERLLTISDAINRVHNKIKLDEKDENDRDI